MSHKFIHLGFLTIACIILVLTVFVSKVFAISAEEEVINNATIYLSKYLVEKSQEQDRVGNRVNVVPVNIQKALKDNIRLLKDTDFLSKYSQIYMYDKNKLLFIWCTGGGAHNNGYLIWDINIDKDKYTANLLNIPTLGTTLGSINKLNAQDVFFNIKGNVLVVNISAGDVTGFKGIQDIYLFNNSILTLIKERSTDKYKAFSTIISNEEAASDFDKLWRYINNDDDWKINYVQ